MNEYRNKGVMGETVDSEAETSETLEIAAKVKANTRQVVFKRGLMNDFLTQRKGSW